MCSNIVTISSDTVTLKDANLEKAIRDALGIPTELLKKEDLAKLTELKYEGKEGAKISDLTGLEYCTNLTGITPNLINKKGRPLEHVLKSVLKNLTLIQVRMKQYR